MEYVRLLASNNSLARNRGLALVAAVSRWDRSGFLDEALGKYLACLRDPKPITVRQSIQHMPKLARGKPQLQQLLMVALAQADFSCYADNMRPLMEKDRRVALAEIGDMMAPTMLTGVVRETVATDADSRPKEHHGAGGLQDA